MAVIYVDDVIFFARDLKKIEDLIKTFKDDGDEYNWEHTIEGTLHSFLGIEISEVERTTVDEHGNKKTIKGYKFFQK